MVEFEMFSRLFEVWVIYRTKKVPRLQRSTILAIRLPALPGWADVWRGGPPGLGFSSAHAGTNEVLALPALNPDFLYVALDATAYAAFLKESRIRGCW
jgi:hypothetical protein